MTASLYKIYDLNENEIDCGTAEELANKYFVTVGTMRHAAINHSTLLSEYKVERVEEHRTHEPHYRLYDDSGKRVFRGTARQIAKILNVPNYKVSYSAHEHKKLAGKYTIIREAENHAD